jgi:hypothetical protein
MKIENLYYWMKMKAQYKKAFETYLKQSLKGNLYAFKTYLR